MKEMTMGLIALIAIVAVVGAIYVYEGWESNTLRKGDFAEVYYMGYFDNNSVFASSFQENVSYDTQFDIDEYNLTPLRIYYSDEIPDDFPDDWSYGDLGSIEDLSIHEIPGLYESLSAIKKGEEKIIELTANEAFGMVVENGTIFNTSMIFGFNETFEILSIGGVTVNLKWVPEIGQIISMPEYWYDIPVQEPHWLWENSTEVTSFLNDTHIELITTPNQLGNLTLYPWWEGYSSAGYDDMELWITTTPPLGDFTIEYMGYIIYGQVLDITDEKIKIEYYAGNETIEDELDRTLKFNRKLEVPYVLEQVQKVYVEDDLEHKGYSFHPLAGNKVIFRVKLLDIYKVS